MQVGVGFDWPPPALELAGFPTTCRHSAGINEMFFAWKTVIDARQIVPYTKGVGSPLVLREPSPCKRRLHQRRVDAVQLDITLVCRRSWKTATFLCGSRRSNRFPVWGAVGRYYFRSLSQGFQEDGVSTCSPLFFLAYQTEGFQQFKAKNPFPNRN